MQRSQKYDWFKGSANNKDKKKDAKQAAKTTWKFLKIFLIFFVLFISLWGCVQGFTLKQSSFVGRGTEFYLNESEIPPHITEWKEKHTDSANAANDIYSLEETGKNIWLNREDQTKNQKDLDAVHAFLKGQGVESMADAYKGVNEANRIVNKDGNSIDSSHAILFDGNNNPVVASTESSKNVGNFAYDPKVNDALTTELSLTIDPTDATKNATSIKLLNGWDSAKGVANLTDIKYTPRTKVDDANIALIRDAFRNSTFNALNVNNWITNALKLNYTYAPADVKNVTVEEQKKIDNIIKAQENAIKVLNYLGYSIDKNNALVQPTWNYMPGMTGETYTPILTWGQAWTRGVGPFYGLAVFPISKFTTAVADAFPIMSGWETLFAMIIVIFVLRFLGFLVTFKSTLQQTKMQELNLKKAAIDAKYAPYKGNKQMQARQRQEVAEMYKKEGVSPMGAFTSVLIVMPLFLAIWRVIGSTPHIKSTVWYGINFSETSWRKLFAGEVIYLPLMAIALGLSIGSQLFPKLLTRKRDKQRGNAHLKQAMKKNDKTQIIIMVITAGMSLIFTAGLQIYWIVVSVWTIIQAYLTHEILKYRHKKVRRKA